MNYSLKDILKNLKVMVISKEENIMPIEKKIIKMFFNKALFIISANRALITYSKEHPDVIICDIDLPKEDGIILCKKIRKLNHKIPIIFLSKLKDEKYLFEIIRLQAIDFVTRPTKAEDLIFALNQTAKNIVNHGNISIKLANGYKYDYKEKTITTIEGKILKLTKNEFRLLELLIANKQKTLTKEEIEDNLWANEEITESAFKSLFSRIRQKIGKESIKNSFGVGYQLK